MFHAILAAILPRHLHLEKMRQTFLRTVICSLVLRLLGSIPVDVISSYTRRQNIRFAVCLSLSFVLLLAYCHCVAIPQFPPDTVPDRTATAKRGEFLRSIRIAGTIETLRYVPIRAPWLSGHRVGRADLTIVNLAESGRFVRNGTVIAEFELKSLEDHMENHRIQASGLNSHLQKWRAEAAVINEVIRQDLLQSQAQVEKSALDLSLIDVMPEIHAEILRNISKQTHVIRDYTRKRAEIMDMILTANLRIYELLMEKEMLHFQRHILDSKRLAIRAPMDGMVIRETIFNRNRQYAQVQEGDRIFSGTLFMRIVDLSQMTVRATVNQVDAQVIHIGSKALVELDAHPSVQFAGRVVELAPLAIASRGGYRSGKSLDYVRHLSASILIEEQDERILPELSASAYVQLSDSKWGILVPREAVHCEFGPNPHKYVYTLKQGEFRKQRVLVGGFNDTDALIESGLERGDRVLLNNP